MFIVVILLLWLKIILLYIDFNVFTYWIDKEYKNTLKKNIILYQQTINTIELLMDHSKSHKDLGKKLHDLGTNNYKLNY